MSDRMRALVPFSNSGSNVSVQSVVPSISNHSSNSRHATAGGRSTRAPSSSHHTPPRPPPRSGTPHPSGNGRRGQWTTTVTTPGYTVHQTHDSAPGQHYQQLAPAQHVPHQIEAPQHIVHIQGHPAPVVVHHQPQQVVHATPAPPPLTPQQQGYTYAPNPNLYTGPLYYRTAPLPQRPPTYASLDAYYRAHGVLPPHQRSNPPQTTVAAAPVAPAAPAPAADPEGLKTLYFSGGESTRQLLHRAGLNGLSVDIGPWKWVGEPGNGGFRICEVRKKKDVEAPKEWEGLTKGLAMHLLMGVRGAGEMGFTERDGWFPGPEVGPAQGRYWNSLGVSGRRDDGGGRGGGGGGAKEVHVREEVWESCGCGCDGMVEVQHHSGCGGHHHGHGHHHQHHHRRRNHHHHHSHPHHHHHH